MRKTNFLGLAVVGLLLGLLAITSCQKNIHENAETDVQSLGQQVSYKVDFELSAGLADRELLAPRATFRNLATGETHIVKAEEGAAGITAELPEAAYEVEVSGYIAQQVNGRTKNRRVSVQQELQPTFRSTEQPLQLTLSSNPFADFKLEEIYFTGSAGNIRDQYFKITNTGGVELDIDGLVITEGSFVTTTERDYDPDILDSAFAVHAIYRIPEEEFGVDPDDFVIVANQAQNHTAAGGLDLSGADFEWYHDHPLDVDNPNVPDLEIVFSYTNSIWVLHNQGYRSYAIGYIPLDDNTYLTNYQYAPEYPRPGGGPPMVVTNTYAFPLSWIADGINLSVSSVWDWNTLYSTVDTGYTGVGAMASDPNRFGKSVRRKIVSGVLQDTDNSTNDFDYGGVTPSFP